MPSNTSSAPPAALELIYAAPGAAVLAALLRRLPPEALPHLDLGRVPALLPRDVVYALLGRAPGEADGLHSTDHPLLPAVAAACGDPTALAELALAALARRDRVGWVDDDATAHALTTNASTPTDLRCCLALYTNFASSDVRDRLFADPKGTGGPGGVHVDETLLRSLDQHAVGAHQRCSALGEVRASLTTAAQVVTLIRLALARDCEEVSARVLLDDLAGQKNLLKVLIRDVTGAPADTTAVAATLSELVDLATAHRPHPYDCAANRIGQVLARVAKSPRLPLGDAVFSTLLRHPQTISALARRTDLTVGQHETLAALASGDVPDQTSPLWRQNRGPFPGWLEQLALNPDVDPLLLLAAAPSTCDHDLLLRCVQRRFGDSPGPWLLLAALLERPTQLPPRIDAVLDLLDAATSSARPEVGTTASGAGHTTEPPDDSPQERR